MTKIRKIVLKMMIFRFLGSLMRFLGFIGCMLAMNISWTEHHHIGWALLHSVSSWLYIFWHTGNHIMLSVTAATILTNLYIWYKMTKDSYVRDKIFEIVSFGKDKPVDISYDEEIKQIKQEEEDLKDVTSTGRKDEGKLRAEDKDKDPS